MKKILFSPHHNFVSLIKNHFSDPDKYLILGVQDYFIKALKDVDVENVEAFVGTDKTQMQAYQFAVDLIKQKKSISKKFSGIDAYKEFSEKIDAYSYPKIYDLAVFLILLDEKKPDIVILHNDVEPFMRLIAMWAAHNNVPCLHIPHSVIIDSSEKSSIGSDIHDIITASHIVVGGEYQYNWYKDRGAKIENIFKTGLPQFDKIVTQTYDSRRARKLLKIDPKEPVVTYASSWRQDTNLLGCHDGVEQTYINFLKASKLLNIRPIIKVHPNSGSNGLNWHIMMAKKIGVYAIVSSQHLYAILQASNILFSFGPSNILLEGSFYPIHLMATHGYDDDKIISKVGSEASETDIAENIKNLLSAPIGDPSEFRYKYIGVADGKSTERIAGVINGLL